MITTRTNIPQQIRPLYETPVITPIAVRSFPHDVNAFTQGLVFNAAGTTLYESTGLYGRSDIREVELATGKILRSLKLPKQYFAEGLTLLRGQLFQLTWRERVVRIYSAATFPSEPIATFKWSREGWGLTHSSSNNNLIISDGSATLYFVASSAPYFIIRKLTVRAWDRGRLQPVPRLNELEWIDGLIYANVWQTTRVAVINPTTGLVLKWLELKALQPPRSSPDMTLNGLAYNSVGKGLFVTGKFWPTIYEIDNFR